MAGPTKPTLDIYLGDNLAVMRDFPDGAFDLIYVDPPFNTGRTQSRTQLRTVRDASGDRVGFMGKRYRTERVQTREFEDQFDDFMSFLEPRVALARRILSPAGSFFLHLDCREVHYAKILCDGIFGRPSFMNEIIWAYDYGARSKTRWPAKHDNILWYARDPERYTFRYDDMDRIPYLAPGLVTPEKRARGKTPTDVWWNTIVSPTGKEKTGYPTQKPLAILNRIVRIHSNPGDRVLDFFAGSGTTGEAAIRNGRSAVLVDSSEEAVAVMSKRLAFAGPALHGVAARRRP
jgi:site-specific DNA-methyltransferase (adenine-specific)